MAELKYLDLYGERLAYVDEGQGEVLLLLHGMAGSSETWRSVVRPLSRNFRVVAPDLLGHGGSDKPRDATMEQWGSIDQASMIDHLAALAPDASRAVIGHSLGGQILGLADNIGSLDAAVLICSQSGHWRHWPAVRRRLRMLALWWLLIPGLTTLTGHFPGAWVGTADLPGGGAASPRPGRPGHEPAARACAARWR